ncbi:chaperone modulator CbpM [Hyphomicrobium sp.]|jgi:chaperone modulatory protein CbpM|uniref:chaperone modulator CbpM n=1 Tax=Hyphomicrobium sp. TaxID=82 RepID=UPI002C8E66AB|nr:chaperone modulator CbpM [Hyphomicrobium sp.]HVZ04994.1 chaperone modulator CbpM [Hyphomicrobium sp.]
MLYHEFLIRARVEDNAVKEWVAAGWLIPANQNGETEFSDIDVARAHLINDLKGGIGVNDEGIGVILHLLDQLHGVRRTLNELLSAVQSGPDDLRTRLVAHLEGTLSDLRTGSRE